MDTAGDAVAVWTNSDGTMQARVRPGPAGSSHPFGAPVTLSMPHGSNQRVAMDPAGDTVVVWAHRDSVVGPAFNWTVQLAFSAGLPTDSGVTIAPNFVAARSGPSIARRTGTNISYTDSQAATTVFSVLKPAARGKHRGRCLAPASSRHRRRCVRYVSVGSFTHSDRAGPNSFRFTGRVGGHKLKPRSYVLQALPRVGGRNGIPTTKRFRITP
jgi:hypothetical protein